MSALIFDDMQQMESPQISFLTIELIERLMNQLPSTPFCVKDRELRFIRVNTAMVKLAGAQSAQDMLGRMSRDFFREESWRRYEQQDRWVMQTGTPISTGWGVRCAKTARRSGFCSAAGR